MDIKIYQVNIDRDNIGIAYQSLEKAKHLLNNEEIDASIYDEVFSGSVDAKNLEDVYRIFNINKPSEFEGNSMSVSDVVQTINTPDSGFYYCDIVGFQQIEFDSDLCFVPRKAKIKAVVCEPGKYAYVDEIGTDLASLQSAVGGYIECYYPFETPECIICNEEGKINGMSPCRGMFDDSGELVDIIFGKFIICDCSGENFDSLTETKQIEYLEKYNKPERFFRVNNEIRVVKYDPKEK